MLSEFDKGRLKGSDGDSPGSISGVQQSLKGLLEGILRLS
jgi:hypothetical protein